MKPKFLQFNCIEGKKIDLRQANAVLRHKPDIIILEYPNNNYPLKSIEKTPSYLLKKENIEIMPWIRSDIRMWKNVDELKKNGHNILVYKIDAPNDLTNSFFNVWRHMYPCALKNWLWWVQIYLREKYMTRNIKWILKNYKIKKNPTILIFLQSFHWDHVKFLLKKSSFEKTWKYYFGKFFEINPRNIAKKIRAENKIFYKYWKKVLDF